MTNAIAVIMPAYNEQEHITAAIASVIEAVKGYVEDYELIVVNDGSTDKTGELAEQLAQTNPHIKVLHNERNSGYSFTLFRGLKAATKPYATVFPGDNEISAQYLRDFAREAGKADLIIAYMCGTHRRSFFRRTLSQTFIFLMNLFFGLRLKGFNGATLYRTGEVRSLPICSSTGMTILAEILVRLIKSGSTYKEIPFEFLGIKDRKSRALRFQNFVECSKVVGVLLKEVYLTPQNLRRK